MAATWERGINTSRTCWSLICNAPSMIIMASWSSLSREAAWRRNSISSSRELGPSLSPERAASSLSSQFRLPWALVRSSLIVASHILAFVLSFISGGSWLVRVGNSEPGQDFAFEPLHLFRFRFFDMIVSKQVQHAMHHQVRIVILQAFGLLPGLVCHDGVA